MTIKNLFTRKAWHRFEESAAFIGLFLLALFPTMEVIARKFFRTGVPYSTDYTHHLVLFVTFIGAMITSRERKHLTLSLDMRLNDHLRYRVGVVTAALSAMMTTAFFWSSLSFVFNAFTAGDRVGFIPLRLFALVMPLGFAVMAVRFVMGVAGKRGRLLAGFGLILGTFLALGPVSGFLGFFFEKAPDLLEPLVSLHESVNLWIATPLIIILILSAILGTPIFVVLGGIGYMLFARSGQALEVIPNEAYSMLISHTIPAIPLFTVAGFVLSESKAGERLVRLFKALFGFIPGGLAIMAILVCTFFTTFTGASGVTILALGGLLYFVLVKDKYEKRFSVGLLTASGSIGLLFPPSLPIIIYGVSAQVSIKDMFIGGILPGLVMVFALSIFVVFYASRQKTQREPFNIKEALSALRESIWEILLPVVILVLFFGGITTLVESGAVAVIYALIVEVFIHKDIKIGGLKTVLMKGLPIIGGVLTILALAKGLSYFIVDAEVPTKLTEWVQANISSKYVFLLLLNFALLITGCLMDIFSAIMVVVPLIIPLGNLFDIHPVHLGIIFLANMELGYMTPPVGLNLFLASYRFNEPMGKIYRDVLPFFLIQLVAVLLITYLPFLSTGLLALF